MKNFIFLAAQSLSFKQGKAHAVPQEQDLQVIGYADGRNLKEAFKKLISDNGYLLKNTFEKVFAREVKDSSEEKKDFVTCLSSKRLFKLKHN
ncbi:MAG: hypothetical protein A2252_12700 [Elusimicrobia bacterium RIFOXYA2_FULL_39_19]|nr:MAG: hypothetical protein A2252_12700 [Elusimicrobia bacterium RIFOXYA2_FULL_39_19]